MFETGKTQDDFDAETKLSLLKEVTVIRDKKINEGFPFKGKVIQADPISQSTARQYFVENMAGFCDFPVAWRTKDNEYIQLTNATDLQEFAFAMKIYVNEHYQASWVVKDNMKNASTMEEVQGIFDAYLKE